MNNEEIEKKLEEQKLMLQEIYQSVEKTRKYFLWNLIITIGVFVLPIIGLIFVIPKFISMLTEQMSVFNSLGI